MFFDKHPRQVWDYQVAIKVESLAKGVFTTKVNPTYDDLPEVRYHFPKTYLNQVKATVGDWIVYYEPRRQDANDASRGGRQVYFATARVQRIAADPHRPDHYYVFVTDFLEFEHMVPFRQGGKYLEDALMKADGSTNKGAFGRSVRLISDNEYQLILQLGFTKGSSQNNRLNSEVSGGWCNSTRRGMRPSAD